MTLAGGWTLEKLRAKTAEERFNIWVNARSRGSPEALELADFIERSGLEYAPRGGISMSDPRVVEMREIVWSPEGQAACLRATEEGQPALAGVEPRIVAQLGDRYGQFSMMTVTAGSLVGGLMLSKGFKIVGKKKMPEGSIAKTAAVWGPR